MMKNRRKIDPFAPDIEECEETKPKPVMPEPVQMEAHIYLPPLPRKRLSSKEEFLRVLANDNGGSINNADLEPSDSSSESDTELIRSRGCPLAVCETEDPFVQQLTKLRLWDSHLPDRVRKKNSLKSCPHAHSALEKTPPIQLKKRHTVSEYTDTTYGAAASPVAFDNFMRRRSSEWSPFSLSRSFGRNSLDSLSEDKTLKRHRTEVSSVSSSCSSSPARRKIKKNLSDRDLFKASKEYSTVKTFFESQDSIAGTDLERENAHFWMSEVVIEAMEMMKYDTINSPSQHSIENIDSEKIEKDSLKENSQLKKSKEGRKRRKKRSNHFREEEGWLLIPNVRDDEKANESLSNNDEETSITSVSQSLPENVAMSILKKYSDDILPFVSNIHLPMTLDGAKLRGTVDWAPPRPQLIYNSYEPPKDIDHQIKSQKWRCPGCGSDILRGFSSRLRFCYYFGKYFCPCCHDNQLSYIPAKVIQKWDFNRYAVSNFAKDVINKNYDDVDTWPFNIQVLNANLYEKVQALDRIRRIRKKFIAVYPYIVTCNQDNGLKYEIQKWPEHWFKDEHEYTLNDLSQVRKKQLIIALARVTDLCIKHVDDCELCKAKACKTVYHNDCFHKGISCPKCERINLRKKKNMNEKTTEGTEE
ncbi:DgyrCDS10974 [Dimorphilus gyrociliatus]|uniref:DgyrCDS10974 n=1 Tax=Dimorphilus gyrociliatus TaxID=2664684 RepID=A0A7I8W3B5_9ANNE|nr:DgyrCDS10974 [Dimorphilus gyrociliatus]